MAGRVLNRSAMRNLKLLLLLLMSCAAAWAQEPETQVNPHGTVEGIEISGVPEDDISQAVRGMMQRLVGQKFDQDAANDLVDRIEIELPGHIATTKLSPGSDADHIKIIFVVEESDEAPGRRSNINSRYTVESVEVSGYDEARLSKDIRDEMQKLVGQRLDHELADRVQQRILRELHHKYNVSRRVKRGMERQHVVVIFEVRKVPWIPFVDLSSYQIYHSKQNISFGLTIPIESNHNRFTFVMVNDSDQLLERFAGIRIGYENVQLGTTLLGIGLHYSTFDEKWKPPVREATVRSPEIATIYRARQSFDPSVTVAFAPRLKLSMGVSLGEMEMQPQTQVNPPLHHENSNAAVASLSYQGRWETPDGDKHRFEGKYDLRAANHKLDSDFIYTRHFAQGRYVFTHDNNSVAVALLAGRISGRAPLFDRFSLGNSTTLRGWNKFDIVPLGGDRVAHGSLEYRYQGFQVFYDAGAAGGDGRPIQGRHSVGFGFAGDEDFFAELAFPIRHGAVRPTFIMGFKF